jgi:AraC-like DNA-binding protein
MALRLIAKHNVNIKFFFSNIENRDLSWLRSTLIVTMLALLSSAFQLFLPDRVTNSHAWTLVYSILGYAWITIFGVLAIKQKPIKTTITNSEREDKKLNNKYKNAPLTEVEIEDIKAKLFYSMDTMQLYKKAGLTLGDLAYEIGISQNKISQVLNNYLGKGFYDFINSCRVSAAQSIMLTQQKSILSIAYEVGFNSKSTFNSAFKKHTEITPSQFKKKHTQHEQEK